MFSPDPRPAWWWSGLPVSEQAPPRGRRRAFPVGGRVFAALDLGGSRDPLLGLGYPLKHRSATLQSSER